MKALIFRETGEPKSVLKLEDIPSPPLAHKLIPLHSPLVSKETVKVEIRGILRRLSASARSFHLIIICCLSCVFLQSVEGQTCGSQGVAVQVLGSGGPELQDKRASSSYLVWEDGRPRVLVDAGGGSALRFGESGAQMSQLDVILFTHYHVDHSGDFSALIKSSWFEDRNRPLPIYGPEGNDFMPSTTEFVSDLFGRSAAPIVISVSCWCRESKVVTKYGPTT